MKIPKIFLLLAFVPVLCSADAAKQAVPCPKKLKIVLDKSAPNHAFHIGEKLTFTIKYEFLVGGEATLEVHEGPMVNCRPTYQFVSNAKSHSWVDSFFTVRDYNSSVADKDSFNSYSFHQNLREGNYRVVRTTTMDYATGTYVFEKERKGKKNKREGGFSQAVHDVFSALYLSRTIPIELGGEYEFMVFSDESIYRLKMKVGPKFEDVKTAAGKFECYRIEPKVLGDGIFKSRDGGMIIWMTSDERRMPVLIRSKVSVGSFDAELRQFDTPQSDMVNEKVPS